MAVLKRNITVRLHDTDAAGILFFARQFYFAHDIYEDFMKEIGIPISKALLEGDYIIPIVHAESQFLKPLRVGDQIDVSLKIASIGNSSYTLEYDFSDQSGTPVGKTKTVHVTIDRASGAKTALPETLRKGLEEFQAKA